MRPKITHVRCSKPYHARKPRYNFGGNFCGHDPDSPYLTLVRGCEGLPKPIINLLDRLEGFYYYPNKLPLLKKANGRKKIMSSERREACVLVMKSLVKHTDLTTLKVGVPQPNGAFINTSVYTIATATHMTLKRVYRALDDLKDAGIVKLAQGKEELPGGKWRSLVAVKSISRHLWGAFGLGVSLSYERKWRSKAQKQKREDWQAKAREKQKARENTRTAKAREAFAWEKFKEQSLLGSGDLFKPKAPPKPPDKPPPDKNTIQDRAERLKKINPKWTLARCIEEAEKILNY